MKKRYIACDFLAGAGGMSEGLRQAGFNIAVANEINKHAAATYRFNHPDTTMIEKDIRNINTRETIDITGTDIFLLVGGPPCQGVSMAGKRNVNDSRNSLFEEFVKMVERLEPRFFLMENVIGLLSMNKGRLVNNIEKSFSEIGYFVSRRILNALDFGVPQNRKRVFIMGSKKGKRDINDMAVKKTKIVTVWDAISDLDFLDVGQSSRKYVKPPLTDYQAKMRKGVKALNNHEAPLHKKKTVKRFSVMNQGESIRDLPPRLRIKKLVMYRLRACEEARTITTLPDDYVHYKKNRVLTVREMARLQSFKDSYVFLGPKSTGGLRRREDCPQYTQVGNAVPPLLAKGICEWLKIQ